MPTLASTVYGSSSGGVRPNGLQGFLPSQFGIGGGLVSGVNISASLTTVLSLTGRFVLSQVQITSIPTASGTLTIAVEVDGVTVASFTDAANTLAIANIIGSSLPISCQSSFVLKAQKPGATAVNVSYQAISVL